MCGVSVLVLSNRFKGICRSSNFGLDLSSPKVDLNWCFFGYFPERVLLGFASFLALDSGQPLAAGDCGAGEPSEHQERVADHVR